ncbi:MAG: hypothetical protein VYE73_18810 [Acidobacteriota bacterium]|nr:hypothetical protein [Acidobacteriota bacterium]
MNACHTMGEKVSVWALLETGTRASELADLTRDRIQWQQRCIRIHGSRPLREA